MAFQFYRTVTIDHTKVPNTDQSNFPVLVSLTNADFATVANGGLIQNTVAQTGGSGLTVPADFKFTSDSAGNNLLNWEFETYTATTGAINAWVKIATVSHTSDTIIYIFYDDTATTTWQGNVNGAWDSNFKMVQHLPDGSTLSLKDSTSNTHNLSQVGGDNALATTGKIDGGGLFDSGSELTAGASTDFNANAYTWSGWFYDTGGTGNATMFEKGDYGVPDWAYAIQTVGSNGNIRIFLTTSLSDAGSNFYDTSGNLFTANAWHHVVVVYDGSQGSASNRIKVYIDGALSAGAIGGGTMPSTMQVDSHNFNVAWFQGLVRPWVGKMDELRAAAIARSADWISTEYNNQNSPGTFFTLGSKTLVGGSTPTYGTPRLLMGIGT